MWVRRAGGNRGITGRPSGYHPPPQFAGRKPAFLATEPRVSPPTYVAVNGVAEASGYESERGEKPPRTGKSGRNAHSGVALPPHAAGVDQNYGVRPIRIQPRVRQRRAAGHGLQRSKPENAGRIPIDDEQHACVTEVAGAVEKDERMERLAVGRNLFHVKRSSSLKSGS